jgi:hypothetical protein
MILFLKVPNIEYPHTTVRDNFACVPPKLETVTKMGRIAVFVHVFVFTG